MGFLTSPDLQKFPLDFATKHVDLTWGDILWGYEHDLFAWYDVIELAQMRVKDTIDFEEYDLVSSLSSVDKSCVWKVSDILKKLAERSITDDESSKKKFLYLSLAWGYANRDKYDNPLDAVSYVYADFGYPDEISHFVPYLPASDGYDPAKHSQKENHQRLLNFWLEYLHDHNGVG